MGIRPEHMEITTGNDFALEGVVKISEALGEVTQVYFDKKSKDSPAIAKLIGVHRDVRDTVLRMTTQPEHVHLFSDEQSLLYADPS